MGKTKLKKKVKVSNPTGLMSVKDLEQEETELEATYIPKDESTIQVIIEQVQSSNIEEKLCGLQMLASMFEEPASVEKVISHNVIRMVAPLLVDQSSTVRSMAAGALRNLSACGAPEICDLLVEQDVMTPLIALIHKSDEWKPQVIDKPGQLSDTAATLVNAVNLLWNLCESNDTAVKYFNSGKVFNTLFKYLDVSIFGIDLAIAVAQCLQTVCEDNATVISALRRSEDQILRLCVLEDSDPSHRLLSTLAVGMLVNMSCGRVTSLPVLISALVRVLSDDHRSILGALSSALPLPPMPPATTNPIPLLNTLTVQLTAAARLLDAQTTAIEILANLCSSQDDDMDEDSSEEEVSNCITEEDVYFESNASFTPKTGITSEVHEAIVKYKVVELVYSKTELPPVNVCGILKEHEDSKLLYRKLCQMRCRGLLCFNNLISVLDIEDLGGPEELYAIWKVMGQSVFASESVTADPELSEAITSAMHAALLKLASIKYSNLSDLAVTDLELIFNMERSCPNTKVRANLIRIIATLGVLFANSNLRQLIKQNLLVYLKQGVNAYHLIVSSHLMSADDAGASDTFYCLFKAVGAFLMEVCEQEAELWLLAECLDALMDVFAEDETDAAAAQLNLVCRLKVLAPHLNRKLRTQKASLGDHYAVVSTVASNLGRFIAYKGARIATLTAPES